MAWCPKCRSEYIKGVDFCKQCQVDLVEDLEAYVEYAVLAEMQPEFVEAFVEYLNYSGISDIQVTEIDDRAQISVDKKIFKSATTHLNAFIYNMRKAEEEEGVHAEEELKQEYETEEMADDTKLNEMHSNAMTYFMMGGIFVLGGILIATKVLNISNPLVAGVFLVFGIILIGLGVSTNKKIPQVENKISQVKDQVETMIQWYDSANLYDDFFLKKGIVEQQVDEGELYFQVVDAIKLDLKQQFPDTEASLLNHAAEEIYQKLRA